LWQATHQQWYDSLKGQWKSFANQLGAQSSPFNMASSIFTGGSPSANQSNAEQQGEGSGDLDQAQNGPGRIVINGNPNARWMGHVMLTGVRPGVDASYIIWCAEHLYSRQGYVTWLEVYIDGAIGQGGFSPQNLAAQFAQAYANAVPQPGSPAAVNLSPAGGIGQTQVITQVPISELPTTEIPQP
jgi:hypothetical protein